MTEQTATEQTVIVETTAGWHRVTYGTWQISVDPHGNITLPKHLHPHDATDFTTALTVAADIAHGILADQDQITATTNKVTRPTGQQVAASIGRTKRRNKKQADTTTDNGHGAPPRRAHTRVATPPPRAGKPQ